MFYPTTCVGFRYGPVPGQASRAVFLGSLLLRRCRSALALRVLSGLAGGVSAAPSGYLPSTRSSVCARAFRYSVTAGTPRYGAAES